MHAGMYGDDLAKSPHMRGSLAGFSDVNGRSFLTRKDASDDMRASMLYRSQPWI